MKPGTGRHTAACHLNNPPDGFLGIVIFDCQRADIGAVVFPDDDLLDLCRVKKAYGEIDLLALEHLIQLHGRVHAQLFADFLVNRI